MRSTVAFLVELVPRAFRLDRHGSVAVWFAMACVPLMICAGAGMDLGRGINQKAQLQAAVDAAALAGASAYTNALTLTTATAIATNYMANFKTTSGLNATYTVTPSLTISGGLTIGFVMTVTASAPITSALMQLGGTNSFATTVKAVAQNPVYNVTINLSTFSSSASDLDTISYYTVPADNGVPTTTTLIFSNALPTNVGSVTLALTASQSIGFMLSNTTGGKPTQTCTTFFFFTNCTTSYANYGTNQYGGAYLTTHYFYSHMSPPSKVAYPGVTQDKSLQILKSASASPTTGSFAPTVPNGSVSCGTIQGTTLYFYWNDMGGTTDDLDYNDAAYTVTCAKVGTGLGQGVALIN